VSQSWKCQNTPSAQLQEMIIGIPGVLDSIPNVFPETLNFYKGQKNNWVIAFKFKFIALNFHWMHTQPSEKNIFIYIYIYCRGNDLVRKRNFQKSLRA
jgi:hypothetical protein